MKSKKKKDNGSRLQVDGGLSEISGDEKTYDGDDEDKKAALQWQHE